MGKIKKVYIVTECVYDDDHNLMETQRGVCTTEKLAEKFVSDIDAEYAELATQGDFQTELSERYRGCSISGIEVDILDESSTH